MPVRDTASGHAAGAAVVLLAAGDGRRVGAGTNKVLLPLAGRPVFTWSVRQVLGLAGVARVVLVVRPQDREVVDDALQELGGEFPGAQVWIVSGGETRHASEWNALSALAELVDDGTVDVVAIHDTARPLADRELFQRVIETARARGGALPVRSMSALVTRRGGGRVDSTLAAVQTPQAFRAGPLLAAYRRAEVDGFTGTDTASCLEEYTDLEIHAVASPATNIKITFPEDVVLAERLLEGYS